MKIEILGSGCPLCKQLAVNAEAAANALNLNAEIAKITEIDQITGYGVMVTPALVIGGTVVSAGKLLSTEEIKKILTR